MTIAHSTKAKRRRQRREVLNLLRATFYIEGRTRGHLSSLEILDIAKRGARFSFPHLAPLIDKVQVTHAQS